MSLVNKIFLKYSNSLLTQLDESRIRPMQFQYGCWENLIKQGSNTAFGVEHSFNLIKSIEEFQKRVPIRDYNSFSPYIERLRSGEDYILWNQKVKWFAKSSGTSSKKSKFIPVTPDSLNINHYGGFRLMLANYLHNKRDSKVFSGKTLTLGGSVKADSIGSHSVSSSLSGDLSAILLSNSPRLIEFVRTPAKEIALLDDFNKKVERICKESAKQDVVSFSGVPSWNLILLNKILEYSGKSSILDIWPNIELFMHGGIGFEPYRDLYKEIIPSNGMNYLENYNASEGYFGFQDNLNDSSMLLTLNSGVFYEFIPLELLDRVISGEITQIPTINEVELGVNYAVVISTVGGLWRYLIGDCIKFVELYPHKIKITGRTQLCINAFGEELMISNAEKAMVSACKECGCSISDFTVAPHFMTSAGAGKSTKGYHVWGVEFVNAPENLEAFESVLDRELTKVNSDYDAKRCNDATMLNLKVISLSNGTFYKWMSSRNKVGGQNKVPRLYKDSSFLDELVAINKR